MEATHYERPTKDIVMSQPPLSERRRLAAEASRGISGEPIYRSVWGALKGGGAGGDLLDFGAGVGNLTKQLYEESSFRSLTGADLLKRPPGLADAVRWIRTDLNEPLDLPEASFDILVAVEVLEHLENPWAVSREWFRLLRPGGLLVASTPNTESWRSLLALLLRGHFVAFGENDYPAHITALLRKDLERVFGAAGFGDLVLRYTDHGSFPKLPHLSWQQVSAGLLRGRRFSDNVVVSGRRL